MISNPTDRPDGSSMANRIGEGTLLADGVVIGHPAKETLLATRDFGITSGATVGQRCILRSGTVIYERAVVGNDVQTAHYVVIREDAHIGDGCVLGNGTVVREGAVLGHNVRLMESVVVSENAVVGNDVFVGPNVSFTAGRQMTGALQAAGRVSYEEAARSEGRCWQGPSVVVEDDVRIGANAVILAGVRLGTGCVVAAGAVVSADVPAGSLTAGNPARVLGRSPTKG
jgi:acetyltransferase-like isoleucine patch superfamily enzyme